MELTQISQSGFQSLLISVSSLKITGGLCFLLHGTSGFRHCCVTLDMLFNLSESEFLSFLKNEVKFT